MPPLAAGIFFALVLVAVHFIVDPRAMDFTGSPRLLALAVFALCFLAGTLAFQWDKAWDFSVLRDPVVVF